MTLQLRTNTTCTHRYRLLFIVLTFTAVLNENKVHTYLYEYYDIGLLGNITSFIEQFTSEIKRDVITSQLLACPYTPICNFTFGLDIPPGYELNCEPCRCDIDCMTTKTCCPDIVPDWMYDEAIGQSEDIVNGNENGEICLRHFGNVYTVCSSNDRVESRNCTHGYAIDQPIDGIVDILPISQMADIMDIVPVTNKKDGRTFLNRNCALCDTDDLEFWDTYITCFSSRDGYVPDTRYSLRHLLLTLHIPECRLEFRNPNFTVSPCSPFATCSDKESQDTFLIGCSLYASLIHRDNRLTFKNINCLVCNGFTPFYVGSLKAVSNNPVGSTFEGKLDYATFKNDVDMESNVTFDIDYKPPYGRRGCGTLQTYDGFTKNCFNAQCPPYTIRFEETCKNVFTEVRKTVYDSFVTFTTNSPMVLDNVDELDHVYDKLLGAIDNYAEYLKHTFGFDHTLKILDIYAHNRYGNMAGRYPLNITDVSIDLVFYFDLKHPVSHPIEIMTNMEHLSQLECTIHLNESVSRHNSDFTLSIQVVKDYRWDDRHRWLITQRSYVDTHTWLVDVHGQHWAVFRLKPCVFVRVCKDDDSLNGTAIQWNETWDGVFFPAYGQTVRVPEFYYPLNEDECIRICLETLHRVITSTPPEKVLAITGGGSGCYFQSRILIPCFIFLCILKLYSDEI